MVFNGEFPPLPERLPLADAPQVDETTERLDVVSQVDPLTVKVPPPPTPKGRWAKLGENTINGGL